MHNLLSKNIETKKKFVVVGKSNDLLFILDFHFFNLLYHKQGKNYSYNKEIF